MSGTTGLRTITTSSSSTMGATAGEGPAERGVAGITRLHELIASQLGEDAEPGQVPSPARS